MNSAASKLKETPLDDDEPFPPFFFQLHDLLFSWTIFSIDHSLAITAYFRWFRITEKWWKEVCMSLQLSHIRLFLSYKRRTLTFMEDRNLFMEKLSS